VTDVPLVELEKQLHKNHWLEGHFMVTTIKLAIFNDN